MRDVQLLLNQAMAITDAHNQIGAASQFEFELSGEKCRSQYLDGIQMYLAPDNVRPKLESLVIAASECCGKISSLELEEGEASLFLSKFFLTKAKTVKARRLVQNIASQLELTDMHDAAAFAWILEDQVEREKAAVVVSVTSEMLKSKIDAIKQTGK
jgi:hypothetical protein